MKRLPVDISTFSELRALDYLYVDKTEYMYRMITGGRRYFLSRPRRFGKSLLVSTLQEILKGNKQLFSDLWIGSSDYAWQEYGVISLDFSKISTESLESTKYRLYDMLITIAHDYDVAIDTTTHTPDLILEKIALTLSKKFGKVAILVDEYDAPILKTLKNKELAEEIRNAIQQFFTTIKSLDAYVQFVFITGVSSFAKAGLFSGINNLQIMTLDDRYAALCGYTDQEIDHYFKEYISIWVHESDISYDSLREQIKSWYNGYSFGYNVPKVYNPFSLMNALNIKKFKNFWFTSGTPTFLIEILKKEYKRFDPGRLMISEDMLGVFDVGTIPVIALMFQAGYLTIAGYDDDAHVYKLDYPNDEVKKSFQKYLLEVFTHVEHSYAQDLLTQLFVALNNNKTEDAVDVLKQLFAHIPYQLHIKQESFYHSLFIMICIGADIKYHAEYSTSLGRIDIVMELPKITYVTEIKFNDTAENALKQIEERRYYENFIHTNNPVILLGLAFKRAPHVFDIEYVEKRL